MYARLAIGTTILMGSGSPPQIYAKPQGITVSLILNEAAEIERVFAALAEGGEIRMPVQETFWAIRFGMLTDKFGVPWMLNYEKMQ